MKILLIHNKYGKHSGEEAMVESVGRVLRDHGHAVEFFYRQSASIQGALGKLRAIATSFRAPEALRAVEQTIRRFQPDIVQIQNVFPLISPHVFGTVRRMGVPVVFRCANYRLFCPTGLMLREGQVCEKCAQSTHLHCLRHNCENNPIKSITYGLRNEYARLRDLITPNVDAFVVPSEFQKSKFISWGIAGERIHVIPNPLPERFREPVPESPFGEYVAYAGRISPEKGIDMILEVAQRHPEIPFKLAGHGTSAYVGSLKFPPNVEYVGMLGSEALQAFYAQARFVVIPSQWYETFGLVAIEAMRFHKPVLAAKIGALQETVVEGKNGFLFRHNDRADFEEKIRRLWSNENTTRELQSSAAADLQARFGDEAYFGRLSSVYEGLATGAHRN